jgi:hypothetical protein
MTNSALKSLIGKSIRYDVLERAVLTKWGHCGVALKVHQRRAEVRRWWREVGRYVWRTYNWVPLTVFAILVLMIGTIGEHQWSMMHSSPARVPQTWLTSLDSTLGLFALSQAPADPMPVALAWARFLAPLAVAAAVVNAMFLVLSNMSHRVRARTRRRHLVIVGCGPTALTIALDAQAHSMKSVAIDLTEASDYSQEIQAVGIPVVTVVRDGEAQIEATLFKMALRGANVKSATDILVVTGSDDTNARAARVIAEYVYENRDGLPADVNWRGAETSDRTGRTSPRIFVESTSLELTYWLQDSLPQLGRNPIEWFSPKERGARDLLDKMTKATPAIAPGTSEDQPAPQLLIVGMNATAAATAVQFCRNWSSWSSGQRILGHEGSKSQELPVLMIVDDPYKPERSDREFMQRVLGDWIDEDEAGAVARCILDPERNLQTMKFRRTPNAVIVALESDVNSIGTARLVRQLFPEAHIWICCEDPLGISSLALPPFEKRMDVVSLSNDGLTIERIRSGIGEDLARSIQRADYVLRHQQHSESDVFDPADQMWDDLDENTKEKNRAAVDGWRTALAKLRFDIVKVPRVAHPSPLDWLEMDFVAEHLHEAWRLVMDERDLWTSGTRQDSHGAGTPAIDPDRTAWASLPQDRRRWSQEQTQQLDKQLSCFDYAITESDWRCSYIERVGKSFFEIVGPGSVKDSPVSWETAPEDSREANRASARAALVYLARLRIGILPDAEGAESRDLVRITDSEVASLAPLEHARWMEKMRREGWVEGIDNSETLRTHPNLVDWESLSPDVRAKDEARIRRLPEVLRHVGYEVDRY